MLIAIVGTRLSGKATIENYFVSAKGFTSVKITGDESVPNYEPGASSQLSMIYRMR